MLYDCIVVGGGPAGLQAAIAGASEGLEVLIVEKGQWGGQIGQTPKLENSVFGNGITGPEFAEMMRRQAEYMGVHFRTEEVMGVRRTNGGSLRVAFKWHHEEGHRSATGQAVILAVGNRWIDPEIEGADLMARRIFMGPVESIGYNATGRRVAVYGGGPSAGQAILALADSPNCGGVDAIMRSTLKMPRYLVDRITEHKNVVVHRHTSITKVEGAGTGMWLHTNNTAHELAVDALFCCNGLHPATDWLAGTPEIKRSATGHILTKLPSLETHMDRVFAVGDCRVGSTPRVGVAIGDGSMAVTELWGIFSRTKSCANCSEIMSS